MDLSEISSLIEIRNYIHQSVNNFNLERNKVDSLGDMLILIDKLIVDKLLANDFKSFINFQDLSKYKAEVVKHNNIKSGLRPDQLNGIDRQQYETKK